MPRTTVNPSTPAGPYPVLPLAANVADLTLAAADVANLNQAAFGNANALLLLAWNSHATTPYDVTIESSPDGLNREGDITDYDLQAGEIAAFRLARNGWRQADGMLYFDGENAAIKFAVIKL